MIKIILAIIFVISSGSLFAEKFRKNKVLMGSAVIVAVISAYYLFLAFKTDIKQITGKVESVEKSDTVLSELPERKQNEISNYPYKAIISKNEASFIFPKEAIDKLFLISPNGDLSGAMFGVIIKDQYNVACQHYVPFSATSPEDVGIYDLKKLLPKLSCSIWKIAEHGGSSIIFSNDVKYKHDKNNSSFSIDVNDKSFVKDILQNNDRYLIFNIGYPNWYKIIEQKVNP